MPTPRTRRIRRPRVEDSDVEMDEKPQHEDGDDGEDEVDTAQLEDADDGVNVEVDGVGEESEEDADSDEDLEDQDEDPAFDEDESPKRPSLSHPVAPSSRLKIKLKMPSQPPSSRFDTPNVESEDDDISNDDSESHVRPSTRPMTTRQAVLASVLDSSHVSLAETRSKKPQLNETELALRREETARKRKNLTEKKLEDEKLETINRLLKKQSRPRNKRTTAQSREQNLDDATPTGSTGNRSAAGSRKGGSKKAAGGSPEGEEAEDEDAMDVEEEEVEERTETDRQRHIPTMYRWVSSARLKEGEADDPSRPQMRITFSVPIAALPTRTSEAEQGNKIITPTVCSAPGCGKPFRYRLVKDWTRGACGIACLKALETAA